MLDRENCVARLRALAVKLAEHPQGNVPEVLAIALGTNPHLMEFYRRLVALEDLGKRARQQIDELSDHDSYDLYVEAIDKIATTFEQLDMRENWSKYGGAFNPRALAHLESCERAITRRLTSAPPSAEDLHSALSDVQEAICGIRDADIDPEAKQLLLEILREAESALQAYHISGLTGLRRAVERMVGAYLLHKQVVDQNQGHEAVERFWKAFGRVVMVTQMIYYIKQLGGVDHIIKMLTE